MSDQRAPAVSPWLWVPTLYFAQGLPNGLHEDVAPALFADLGVKNDALTHALALAAIPWMLKAFWSPVVDSYGTKRRWIWLGQLVGALAFAAFAAAPFADRPERYGLVCLALVALGSATHDIAADGFYLFGVRTDGEQAFFSGIRNTTFRLAKVFSASAVVGLAAYLMKTGRPVAGAWGAALALFALAGVALAVWHARVLPKPPEDRPAGGGTSLATAFVEGWSTFFRIPGIGRALLFILFFRLSEALLSALFAPFLKNARADGGIGLAPETFAWMNGLGVVALLSGGLLGGFLVSRFGLRRMLWPMVAVMHLPNLAFLGLAIAQPEHTPLVVAAVGVEKFGYGFGMTAIMLYLISLCRGERRVTHYALCSGFMLLGYRFPAYFAGDIQGAVGYVGFFQIVLLAIIPGVAATRLVRDIDPAFGKR